MGTILCPYEVIREVMTSYLLDVYHTPDGVRTHTNHLWGDGLPEMIGETLHREGVLAGRHGIVKAYLRGNLLAP